MRLRPEGRRFLAGRKRPARRWSLTRNGLRLLRPFGFATAGTDCRLAFVACKQNPLSVGCEADEARIEDDDELGLLHLRVLIRKKVVQPGDFGRAGRARDGEQLLVGIDSA